ncbi:MAG: hypothetical protein AAF432_02865 [Planctomycetota bacterium]
MISRRCIHDPAIRCGAAIVVLLLTSVGTAGQRTAPVIQESETSRYTVSAVHGTFVEPGKLDGLRREFRDVRGRLIRWQELDADIRPRVTWIGVYDGTSKSPSRAAYWIKDELMPYPELFVTSPDGRYRDVYYGAVGEWPRRQIRDHLDDAGREIYQQYYAPKSQEFYSEELYAYDAFGNEISRTWRRLDGTEERATRFEIIGMTPHGHWTHRLVFINDELTYRDLRTITYSETKIETPPASQGPVDAPPRILPAPFAPGIIATERGNENTLTLTADRRAAVFTRYSDDWTQQNAMISIWRDGMWRDAEVIPAARDIYNIAFANAEGTRLLMCRRKPYADAGVYIIERTADGWSEPTVIPDFEGYYFNVHDDGTMYFHRNGDLYRGTLDGSVVSDIRPLGAPINTKNGVEFGAWVDMAGNRIIFTRNSGDRGNNGVFVAHRVDGRWTEPRKLPIRYGWSPIITSDGLDFIYTTDDDICRIPVPLLKFYLDPSDNFPPIPPNPVDALNTTGGS